MSRQTTFGNFPNLYDADTGAVVGFVDRNGREQRMFGRQMLVTPPQSPAGWHDTVQGAVDFCFQRGGGDITIAPGNYTADIPVVVPRGVNVDAAGVGVVNVTVVDHFPLVSIIQRQQVAGVWMVDLFPILQRALFYLPPTAPFDPGGMIQTPSNYRMPPTFRGFTVFGDKFNQDGPVSVLYAPPGNTDPEWARVSGAYATPGYPSGTINLNADPGAYDGFVAEEIEAYQMSGTPFFAGSDRQRGKIGRNCRGIGCGVLDGNGNILYDGAGFETQGNDWVIEPGAGFGGNTSPVKGGGQSGSLRAGLNAWSQKGPNAYLAVFDVNVNGASLSNSVLNAAYRAQVTPSNGNARTGISITGVHFLPDDALVTAGQPSGTIPSVPDDGHNAYISISGYRHTTVSSCNFSTDNNGKSFKFVVAATNKAGVHFTGTLSSETGVQPYLSQPFYTDNTGGVITYDYVDPNTGLRHIGVHANGVAQGVSILATQLLQFETPIYPMAGIVGQSGAAAPAQGFQGEPFFASASVASLTSNTATDVVTMNLNGPLEADFFGIVQLAIGASPTTLAMNADCELTLSSTSGNISTAAISAYDGNGYPLQSGLSNQPLLSLRVGPVTVRLAQGQSETLYLTTRAKTSTNPGLSASGVIRGRRL